MLKSLNQLRNEFQQLVAAMHMPHSFYWGEWLEAYEQSTIQHPLVCVTVRSATMARDVVSVNLTVTVSDKVFDDRSNADDVQSDTLRILRDIFQIMQSKRWRSFLTGQAQQTSNATFFRYRGGDITDGWFADFQLNIAANLGLCDIPISGDYDLDENLRPSCPPVTLLVNGDNVAIIPSGTTYQLVVKDTNGDVVGSLIDNEWIVPAVGSSQVTITDSDGNILYVVDAPDTQMIQDSTWELRNTNNVVLNTGSILAEGAAVIQAPNAGTTFNGESMAAIPSGESVEFSISSSVGPIGSKDDDVTWLIPDSTIKQPNGSVSVLPPATPALCTQIPNLQNSDLIAQMIIDQILAVYEGRVGFRFVEFTSVGTHTYTTPPDLLMAFVGCIGGGGGAGSGAGRTSGTAMPGQMGGGGGIATRWLSPSIIGASQIVTVGAGGIGGAGATVSTGSAAGNSGTNGGTSSFGSLVLALGGFGGAGGSPFSTTISPNIFPHGLTDFIPPIFPNSITGDLIQQTSSSIALSGVRMFNYRLGCGGNGAPQSNVSTVNGGDRPEYYDMTGTLISNGGGGIHPSGSGAHGVNDACRQWITYLGNMPFAGYGQHGAGGAGAINADGGNGGNGGHYGGGGGGGGAVFRSAGTHTTGKGGDGGNGCVVVMEIYVIP